MWDEQDVLSKGVLMIFLQSYFHYLKVLSFTMKPTLFLAQILILIQQPSIILSFNNTNVICDIQVVDTDKNIYFVSCHTPKAANSTKIGCCSITQIYPFHGLAHEWGTNCIRPENNLNDHIQIIAFSTPTETTCHMKFTLLTRICDKTCVRSEFCDCTLCCTLFNE